MILEKLGSASMITNREEINIRFDAIKDHKPRAAKKLKELGEILASAYKLDPQWADEMWQYIIELNIKDNISFSKFYVAQVFNKLIDNLSSQEAAEFVTMRPERIRLMFIYGYDGDNLNRTAYTIIGSQLFEGEIESAIETVSFLKEKFTTRDDLNIYAFYSTINTVSVWLENNQEQYEYAFRFDISKEYILDFYETCCQNFKDELMQSLMRARSILLTKNPIQDLDDIKQLLYTLLEMATHTDFEVRWLFTELLYYERDLIGNEVESIIFEYCRETDSVYIPVVPFSKDENVLEKSNWYRDIITQSERILRELFRKTACQDVHRMVIHDCMYESDWRKFLQYIVLGLNQEKEYNAKSYLELVKEEIRFYLNDKKNTIESEIKIYEKHTFPPTENQLENSIRISISFTPRRSIVKPRVTTENVNDFILAMARICVLTSNSIVHEQLIDEVKSFVTKETGSVDLLNMMGLEEEADYRSTLEKFCDYADSESVQRSPYDYSYDKGNQISQFIRSIQQEMGINGIETGKLLAKQPQILSFLFLHDAHSFAEKGNIILGALKDNDYSTALKCVDYLIETAKYPNFSERNSWSMEMKNTLSTILRNVYQQNFSEYGEPYSENITQTVIQITERCLPYLGGSDANVVRANLLKVKPSDDQKTKYLRYLLQDVDEYTAEKKPKGYSKRINDITSGIQLGIEVLAQLNRMDVVAQILRKITKGRDYISGPSYESWMTDFLKITDEQCIELYSLIPDVYTAYIEVSNQKMALKVLNFFGKVGNQTVYEALKGQIIQKHGYIEGMSSCFKYSEQTAKPILLLNDRCFKLSLLYWNALIDYRFDIYGMEISLCIKNMYKEYISVYAVDVVINGIQLSQLQNQQRKNLSDRKCICYSIASDEEKVCILNLWWGDKRDPTIKEISSVSFTAVVQSGDKVLSKSGPFMIKYDVINECYIIV